MAAAAAEEASRPVGGGTRSVVTVCVQGVKGGGVCSTVGSTDVGMPPLPLPLAPSEVARDFNPAAARARASNHLSKAAYSPASASFVAALAAVAATAVASVRAVGVCVPTASAARVAAAVTAAVAACAATSHSLVDSVKAATAEAPP